MNSKGLRTSGRAPLWRFTVTGWPLVMINAAPRTMLNMPSVAISDGSLP